MRRILRRTLLALTVVSVATALATAWVTPGRAAGLKTTFVKVSLENLRAGDTYSIRQLANLPLAVYNTGADTISLKVEATIPLAGELREGYEPIPDLSWIRLTQDVFEGIRPGASAMTDVAISIPSDGRCLGKHYQVMIWSHTVGDGLIACGLKGEVLFGVSSETARPLGALTMLPTAIYVEDAVSGDAALRIFNPSDETVKVRLAVMDPGDTAVGRPRPTAEGYSERVLPDAISLEQDVVEVSPRGTGDARLAVKLPAEVARRGGRYAFVVSATRVGESAPAAYSVIYISTRE
jgi:hypothetical protein